MSNVAWLHSVCTVVTVRRFYWEDGGKLCIVMEIGRQCHHFHPQSLWTVSAHSGSHVTPKEQTLSL